MPAAQANKPPTESAESRHLIHHAFELARTLGIAKMLVHADQLLDRKTVDTHRQEESIVWLTREKTSPASWKPDPRDHQIVLPDAEVDRMDQIDMGLLLAVLNGHIGKDETIVCLTGLAGSKRLDNLLITNPERDNPWFQGKRMRLDSPLMTSRTFSRLLGLALRFAGEGREGKPIGTIFVLGDPKKLERHTKPLILNPCKGHRKEVRNIHNSDYVESIRELAALDGAFIVDPTGVVERAAVYLNATVKKQANLRQGLGARHMAAAAISTKNCTAIVISESSGTVTVFHQGLPVLEIERAKS